MNVKDEFASPADGLECSDLNTALHLSADYIRAALVNPNLDPLDQQKMGEMFAAMNSLALNHVRLFRHLHDIVHEEEAFDDRLCPIAPN